MSRSLRFLGFAVTAWVGIRAVSLGMVPGTEMLAIDRPANAATLPETTPLAPSPLSCPTGDHPSSRANPPASAW